ncbi:MAG: CtsR family transcriptional regulator, partial [Pyramidobacter sp.]|nr:CtsR family transcriptional regulator [Pyramidobacter sp.]
MSSLTEVIESYINELFQQEEQDGTADADRVSLRRKDVAERFGCVPSQINYVLRSRFTPERG